MEIVEEKISTDESLSEKLRDKYRSRYFTADFDCRAFNIPKEEVCNCVIWRQNDAEKNSIQSLAQSLYSHKELNGLKCNQLQNKMFTEKGVNWSELPTYCKRGSACIKDENGKWFIDYDMPILKENRDYLERFVYCEEE
jgi:tRNA(His) 5'-end guanylyltransferase